MAVFVCLFAVCCLLVFAVQGSPVSLSVASTLPPYLDHDGDGFACFEDLVSDLDAVDLGMGTNHKTEIPKLVARYDLNQDGCLSGDEFNIAFPGLYVPEIGDLEPQQTHLSLINDTNIMVMWVTMKATATTTVQYGSTPSALSNTLYGSTHTYTAGGWKGVIHQVLLPELLPATQYFYRVGDPVGGWSKIFNFTTPPVVGQETKTEIIAFYGDMGTAIPLGYEVCQQIYNDSAILPLDLIVHVGDIAYASTQVDEPTPHFSADLNEEAEMIWDAWFRQVEPLAANYVYMAGVGNHEKFYNYSSYLARFRMPAPWGGVPTDPDNQTMWFSINYGLVHYVFLSSEHPYDPTSPQYAWLVQDLIEANKNRDAVPWIFMTAHRPFYCSDADEQSEHWPGSPFIATLEPLMIQYGVDVTVEGHMHMYERVHPNINGTVLQSGNVYHSPGAPVHIVQGTGGVFQDFEFVQPQPVWSAYREGRIGYGRMHLYNATHLYYEFLALETRTVVDEFWLTK